MRSLQAILVIIIIAAMAGTLYAILSGYVQSATIAKATIVFFRMEYDRSSGTTYITIALRNSGNVAMEYVSAESWHGPLAGPPPELEPLGPTRVGPGGTVTLVAESGSFLPHEEYMVRLLVGFADGSRQVLVAKAWNVAP